MLTINGSLPQGEDAMFYVHTVLMCSVCNFIIILPFSTDFNRLGITPPCLNPAYTKAHEQADRKICITEIAQDIVYSACLEKKLSFVYLFVLNGMWCLSKILLYKIIKAIVRKQKMVRCMKKATEYTPYPLHPWAIQW